MCTTLARISLGLCWVATTIGIVIFFFSFLTHKTLPSSKELVCFCVLARSCSTSNLAVVVLLSRGKPNYPENELLEQG